MSVSIQHGLGKWGRSESSEVAKKKNFTKAYITEKSSNDRRQVKRVVLANDLHVLLVSDPQCQSSAAAMDVQVGHFSDPEGIPGLAHFCEHMLFMGTETFPE